VSFMGLSSYLLLVGIYSAAISVAQDVKLRNIIRKSALNETRFLDNIGYAQMEQRIVGDVLSLAKRNEDTMKEETGLVTSMEQEDIVSYLNLVLNEIKNEKARNYPGADSEKQT
jgi:hypothetical protein